MTERPILFNPWKVQRIHAGATQTRRPMKTQPPSVEAVRELSGSGYHWMPPNDEIPYWRVAGPVWAVRKLMGCEPRLKSPFGGPGDLLWVRECFAHGGGINGEPIVYRADWPSCKRPCDSGVPFGGGFPDEKWTPSIHMPRWASRTTLRVERVWVEQVQSISEEDAEAEGIDDAWLVRHHSGPPRQNEFRHLWDSIYAAKGFGWEQNPWVWCCEFEVKT